MTWSGVYSLPDLIGKLRRFRDDGTWSYSVLVDAREARTDLSTAEAREFVSRMSETGDAHQRGPVAVVTLDDTTYGMARMLAALTDSIGMRVEPFRDLAEAEAWLDEIDAGGDRHKAG